MPVCVCVCFCAVFIVEMLHNFIKTTQKRFLHFYWLFAIISPYFDLICMCVCAFFVDFNCRLGEIPSIWIRNAKKNNTWEREGKKHVKWGSDKRQDDAYNAHAQHSTFSDHLKDRIHFLPQHYLWCSPKYCWMLQTKRNFQAFLRLHIYSVYFPSGTHTNQTKRRDWYQWRIWADTLCDVSKCFRCISPWAPFKLVISSDRISRSVHRICHPFRRRFTDVDFFVVGFFEVLSIFMVWILDCSTSIPIIIYENWAKHFRPSGT